MIKKLQYKQEITLESSEHNTYLLISVINCIYLTPLWHDQGIEFLIFDSKFEILKPAP